MENIIEGIQIECNRLRATMKQYEEIGPNGTFGKMMFQDAINRGEKAIASNNEKEMISVYEYLKAQGR